MTDDTLKDLAARLHAAHQELADENNREDQRLIEEAARLAELAESAAQRIEARAVEVEAAEAAMLAYGLEKASEGAVKVEISTEAVEDEIARLVAARDSGNDALTPLGESRLSELQNVWRAPYSNGLDGQTEE